MKTEKWDKEFNKWWNKDKPMQQAISAFDIGMQGILVNQTRVGFRRGFVAALPKWIYCKDRQPKCKPLAKSKKYKTEIKCDFSVLVQREKEVHQTVASYSYTKKEWSLYNQMYIMFGFEVIAWMRLADVPEVVE